jgi:hypothetical protein
MLDLERVSNAIVLDSETVVNIPLCPEVNLPQFLFSPIAEGFQEKRLENRCG